MKKNIVITILAILVLGMGGYLIYDKVIDKDVQKEEVKTEKEESYDLEAAKKLVDKYILVNTCGETLITQGLSYDIKMSVAYENILDKFVVDLGYDFENDEVIKRILLDNNMSDLLDNGYHFKYIRYESFLEVYESLFGKDLNLKGKNSTINCPDLYYVNDKILGEIILITGACGCGPGITKSYEVLEAVKENDELIVKIGYIELEATPNLIYTLDGKNYEEDIPEDILSNYIKTSNDVDKYNLIFKKEKENYYLEEIEKL